MSAEWETSFLADVNQNIRIVHRVCHTYFPRDDMEREESLPGHHVSTLEILSAFKGESKFSTWMHKVALNTAITHIRRSTRKPRSEELAEPIDHAPDMNEHMHRKEEIHQLYKAIDTLLDIDKAIILLHLEDQDYDEIAAITGLHQNNVSVRLVRIRRALKEYVERNQLIQRGTMATGDELENVWKEVWRVKRSLLHSRARTSRRSSHRASGKR